MKNDSPKISYVNKIRVRYNDTDCMGIVYHGNYAMYFEVTRLEMLRSRGLVYRDMESRGVMLPVSSIEIKYHRSAFYDDILDVEVILTEKPSVRLNFDYRITNEKQELICTGKVTLACVDRESRRPCRAPQYLLDCFPEFL